HPPCCDLQQGRKQTQRNRPKWTDSAEELSLWETVLLRRKFLTRKFLTQSPEIPYLPVLEDFFFPVLHGVVVEVVSIGSGIGHIHHTHAAAAHAAAHAAATHAATHSAAHSAATHSASHASHHSHAAATGARGDDRNHQVADRVDARTQ